MLTLAHPSIKRMEYIECGEAFVNLQGIHERIAVDMSRQLISSDGDYFCWSRHDVAKRLVTAARRLPPHLRLLVVEAYRSLDVQRSYFRDYTHVLKRDYPWLDGDALYEKVSQWVAPPEVGGHPTGAAIDLTLQHIDGGHVDMGTVLNANDAESSGACFTDSAFITREAARNRAILRDAMSAAGFVNYPSEWWHWSYGDRYWAVVSGKPHAVYGPVEEFEVEGVRV